MSTTRQRESVLRAFLWFAVAAIFLQLVIGALVFYLFEKWDERSGFGDMFGVASCLFSGLALAGIILSLKFQSDELLLTRQELSRQFRLSLVSNVLSEMDRPEVHAARSYVYKHFQKYAAVTADPLKLAELDAESYERGSLVSNSFDRVGVLVADDETSRGIVLQCFGPSIARSWVALEPMIRALRKGLYGPEHECFFEALAQDSIARIGRDGVEAMLQVWGGSGGGAAPLPSNEEAVARHEKEVEELGRLPLAAREAYWDAFYRSPESSFLFSDAEVGRFGVIAELIRRRPGFSRVLDVGCGAGGLCALLQPGDDYLGIDISRAAVEQAAAAHPGRDFEVASLEVFSREVEPFDFVVLSEMLFYTDPVGSLARAASFLRPDTGRLIVSTYASPSGEALHRLLRERLDVLQEVQITAMGAKLVWQVQLANLDPAGGTD